ncbi:MAG: glycerophosphodiester phosphodiesterase [Acidobacteriota bacterium]
MAPLLLGHRGARACKSIPENTFASFDQALADGCDGFEFDVRLTADGCALVCHDPHGGGIEIAAASRQQALSLPRFEDVVARYHARAFLDIELKVSGLERTAVAALKEHWPERGLVVSSFLPEVVLAMQAEYAAIPVGLICETRAELLGWRNLPIQYVIPHHKLVDASLVQEVQRAGKKILVWTVNSRAEMEKFRGWGVDGIISDHTSLLVRTLRAHY